MHTNISEEPVKDSLVKWVMSLQLCGWRGRCPKHVVGTVTI